MRIYLSYNTKKYLKIFAILTAILLLVKITMKFEIIAEYFYARGISRLFTNIFQNMSNAVPFSIYEFLLVSIVIVLICFIIKAIISKKYVSDLRAYRFLYIVVFLVSIEIITYNVVATALYNRVSVAKPLDIETSSKVDQEKVIAAATYYINGLNEIADTIDRDENGNVIIPYSFDELNNLLNKEYKRLDNKYFNPNYLRLKEVNLSVPMTYTGITGAYVGILGEGSINTNVPNYTLAITMAHEMAHSKGVFLENEANFTAYYLCITSEDKFLRYCGLMYASAICYNKIDGRETENKEIKKIIYESFSDKVITEYGNSDRFFQNYEGIIEKASNFINNLYLKSAGVKEGTLSYSLTDIYLVSLYEKLNK